MPKRLLPLHIANPLKGEPIALVAGGAGFLGSYLCEELLKTCRVICIDNLSFGKREYIERFLQNEKFTFIEYDIARPLTDLLRQKVDYVFHVAGVDEVDRFEKANLDDLLLNTYGTRNLLEKAVSDKAKFVLVSTLAPHRYGAGLEHEKRVGESIDTAQARLFSESLTGEYAKKFGIDARIIRLAHVFGPRMPLGTQNPLSIIVGGLLTKKAAVVANDGSTRIYPLYVNDCVNTILYIMFTHGAKGKICNIIPATSITLLEFAEVLKNIDSGFMLHVGRPDGERIHLFTKENFQQGSLIEVAAKDALVHQLVQTLAYFQKERMSVASEKKVTMKDHISSSPRKTIILTLLASIIFFTTLLPMVFFVAASAGGVLTLNGAYRSLHEGDFEQAKGSAQMSRQLFGSAKQGLSVLSYHFMLAGKEKEKNALFLLLQSGERAADVSLSLVGAASLLGEFFKESVKGAGFDAKPALDSAIGQLTNAANQLPILEKELDEVNSLPLPPSLASYIEDKQALLAKYRETVDATHVFAGLLPDLLGFEDKRVYGLLLQNNMELRPTGGFIGSYGIVAFEKGSLSSFDIFDVYDADGQLKGHIDPPAPIRKYLQQPNWFLRDSNWDPDFQIAATQSAWFLQKETGVATHGIIGIDVTLVKYLLETLGPVSLPDYQETITSDNLFEKAETHAEADFFPGSSQKKDFLGALNRRLIDQMLHDEHVPWLSVLSAVKKGLTQKHVLFSFNNPAVQQVFTLRNWGGTILSLEEPEGTFADYRMLTEANLGVNKANYFVKRKVSDEITIDKDGQIAGTLTLAYSNEGPPTWPGGTYTNYMRAFFPHGAKLTGLLLDGQEATISGRVKGASGGIDVDEATASAKTVFGFLVTVEPKTTQHVAIRYQLPKPFPILPGSSTYAYLFQKQPGTNEDPLTVMVHYPQGFTMKNTNALVFKELQSVTLVSDLAEDRLFKVEFLR